MNRLIIPVALAVALLTAPAAAPAASPHNQTTVNASVANGVLSYTSGVGTVDAVTISPSFGGVIISEPTSPEGSPVGTGCSIISAASAYCFGVTSTSVQTLDLDDTLTNWSSVPATLDAGAGNDTITGGGAAETLNGGEGNDTIKGGNGADKIYAGAGDDKVDVKDGAVDTVDCGAGSDSIVADPADVLTDCDIPTEATGTAPGTGDAGTPTGTAGDAQISAPKLLAPATIVGPIIAAVSEGSEVTVGAKGVAPFVFGCSATETKACTGQIFIDPAPAAKAKGKKAKGSTVTAYMARRGRYGSSPFTVKPGSEDKVDVRLSGIALKALGKKKSRKARAARRGRRVRAVVTIAPKQARAQRVTIVLKG